MPPPPPPPPPPPRRLKLPDNSEYQSNLVSENDRLRKELLELRRQLEASLSSLQRKPECSDEPKMKSVLSDVSLGSFKKEERPTKQQKNVVLELPVTLRACSSSSNEYNNNNNDNNNSNRNKTVHKDHMSVSTTDERETVEPNIDVEAHQSAAGLYRRSITNTNSDNDNNNNNNIDNNISAISDTDTIYVDGRKMLATNNAEILSSSSFTTRRTDNLTDYSSSSTNDDDDDYNTDDGRISEEQGLICERDGTITNHPQQQHQQLTFCQSLTDRAGWLIGLLIFQSLSSFILARNESLLQHHGVIVQFLTMLVGAGGNAGNQASVGVIRGIATGAINKSNEKQVLRREFAMGLALSAILGLAGFVRAKVFLVPWLETIAITASLSMIVIISVAVGAILPLCMLKVGIDPAHSSTTIQVIMDITGVMITVHVCSLMLDSEFHDWLEIALSLDGETR